MNEDKLYEAARSETFDLVDGAHQTDSKDLVEAFVSGARWLMSLPLADRLSESEKEKMRKLHALYGYKMIHLSSSRQTYRMRQMGLEDVFGKDFFNPTEQ